MKPLQLPLIPPESDWRPAWPPPNIRGAKRISFDTENCDPDLNTLGPSVRRGGYVAGFSVGVDGGPRFYLPMRHQDGGNLNPDKVLAWAREELNAFSGELVGAGLVYDLDWSAELGVTFPNVRRFMDVQVAEPLLDEWRLEYSLDALSRDYLGEGKDESLLREAAVSYGLNKSKKKITDEEVKSNIWRMHSRFAGPYGEGDADRPLRILPLQLKKLEQQGLLDLFELESKLIPILVAMRRRGVRIDEAGALEVRAQLVTQRDSWLDKVRSMAGPDADFMRPEVLGPALERRGVSVPRTGTGRFSIQGGNRGGWLKENLHDELAEAIWRGRRVETVINTFLDGHVLGHLTRGRVHCEFHQLKGERGGTIARFSSSNPNLQNLPAMDEEMMHLVRGLFLPEEGEDWLRQDESQMEYRLLAHYAVGPGSAEIREKYRNDPKTSYHLYCAELMGVDAKRDHATYKRIKNTNFAKGYGAMPPKLAATFGCTVEEAERFVRRYDRALPFSKKTFEHADRVAQEKGYIRSLLGRYARFILWEPASNKRTKRQWRLPAYPRARAEKEYPVDRLVRADTYTALNRLLQFGNADYMKKTMVDMWESGICAVLGAPLLTVHDELGFSKPRTKAGDEAAKEAKYLHEHAIKLRVPVYVEEDIGANWGETS